MVGGKHYSAKLAPPSVTWTSYGAGISIHGIALLTKQALRWTGLASSCSSEHHKLARSTKLVASPSCAVNLCVHKDSHAQGFIEYTQKTMGAGSVARCKDMRWMEGRVVVPVRYAVWVYQHGMRCGSACIMCGV